MAKIRLDWGNSNLYLYFFFLLLTGLNLGNIIGPPPFCILKLRNGAHDEVIENPFIEPVVHRSFEKRRGNSNTFPSLFYISLLLYVFFIYRLKYALIGEGKLI